MSYIVILMSFTAIFPSIGYDSSNSIKFIETTLIMARKSFHDMIHPRQEQPLKSCTYNGTRNYLLRSLSLVHTANSVGDFSPRGKWDRMNDMQKEKRLCILLCASSLIYIRQKHKIADKIASVNQALINIFPSYYILTT
jgi:hypothetical protein